MLGRLLDTQLSPKLIELREIHSRCPRCKNVVISDAELLECPMVSQVPMRVLCFPDARRDAPQQASGKLLGAAGFGRARRRDEGVRRGAA